VKLPISTIRRHYRKRTRNRLAERLVSRLVARETYVRKRSIFRNDNRRQGWSCFFDARRPLLTRYHRATSKLPAGSAEPFRASWCEGLAPRGRPCFLFRVINWRKKILIQLVTQFVRSHRGDEHFVNRVHTSHDLFGRVIDGSAELSHRVFLDDIFLILIVDLK